MATAINALIRAAARTGTTGNEKQRFKITIGGNDMTLTQTLIKDAIFIDFGSEVVYGSDQAYINSPVRFPTVTFELVSSALLTKVADRIRMEQGFRPMYPVAGYDENACDEDGWYRFSIGINGFADNKMDASIEFVVENSESEDNDEHYAIYLNPGEQMVIYERLNEQCIKHLGKSCEELLAEARKEIPAEYCYGQGTGW